MRNRASLLAAVVTTLAVSHVSAADLPGKGITVQPIQSTIAEETFQTLIVSRALENSAIRSASRVKWITTLATPLSPLATPPLPR